MKNRFVLLQKILIVSICSLQLFSVSSFAQHKTLGPGGCGLGQSNCHSGENDWWKDDDHKVTIQSIYDSYALYSKIADLAGVGADNMMKGSSSCMKCHGTVVSGNEAGEVDEGVSCESCHGPGSVYKEKHTEGDPKAGKDRPGYAAGLKLGMVELANLAARAETCVRCHYVTDEKLLRAGHPSGATFGYAKGIRSVSKHWDRAASSADTKNDPFKKAMEKRGPIPTIAIATSAGGDRPAQRAYAPPPPPPHTSVDPVFPLKAARPISLEPFPVLPDSATFQQIMIVLKARLELLYKKIGK